MDDSGEMECLRQECDDKDAQLRLAAEIGQAVVEENEAMKHRLEEMQTVLEESEHRAACAEAEREKEHDMLLMHEVIAYAAHDTDTWYWHLEAQEVFERLPEDGPMHSDRI